MDDHHAVGAHTHQVQHLTVVLEFANGRLYHSWFVTSKLSVLAWVHCEAVSILVGERPRLSQNVGAVIEAITIFFMGSEREHL